jgi:hypothetical protein
VIEPVKTSGVMSMVAVKGGWVYYVLIGICLERVYVEMESEKNG